MSPRRVGVLGGTFDPIHVGHLAAARAAQHALGLDAVLFIPSGDPPHRPDKPRASGYHRSQMAALAIADVPGWSVSDLEVNRSGVSYTFDTLTALRETSGGTSQFFFIVGADAFADIATWSRYPAVIDLATFAVIARPGTSLDALCHRLPALAPRMSDWDPSDAATSRRPGAIVLIPAETPQISSTEIRRRVAAGEPPWPLVPDQVAQYIATHGLYRSPDAPADPPRSTTHA
jgi:nicotinate-nucleotide adenylyltransferase